MKDANSMKIKSYFARSVDDAIAKARVELGSEALLLNTRKLPDAGGYEVVMGVAGPASAPKIPAAAPTSRTIAKSPDAPLRPTEVSAEMEKLRAQMDELQSLLVRSARNSWSAQRSVPEVADVYDRLIAADVDTLPEAGGCEQHGIGRLAKTLENPGL